MYKYRVDLITMSDVEEFVTIMSKLDVDAYLTDGTYKSSPKSFLGTLYAKTDYNELILESDKDIYTKIEKFIKE